MPEMSELGERIRQLRLAKNLTLKDVERKAEVSATHVSEIERGMTSPTVGALARIARALGTRPSRLIETDRLPAVSAVARAQRRVLTDERQGIRLELLSTPVRSAEMTFAEVVLPPGGEGVPVSARGEVFVHVLGGEVEVDVGGTPKRLRLGESLHFTSRELDAIRNTGEEEARLLWASTPPLTL